MDIYRITVKKNHCMKLFVISLERCQERRRLVEANLQSLNLEYELVNAVDGKKLSNEELALVKTEDRICLDLASNKQVFVTNKLTDGEIGCALSHLKVYQKIIDLDLDYACILEDDVALYPPILKAFENIDKITEPWDVINFTHHKGVRSSYLAKKYYFGESSESCKIQYFKKEGMNIHQLDVILNIRRLIAMAACYVITKDACKRLIEIGYPVRLAADYLLGYFPYNKLRIFKVFPDKDYYLTYNNMESLISSRPTHVFERSK